MCSLFISWSLYSWLPSIIPESGLANHSLNSLCDWKMCGIRKCISDQSSIRLFCSGVPVNRRRRWLEKFSNVCHLWDLKFFMFCAYRRRNELIMQSKWKYTPDRTLKKMFPYTWTIGEAIFKWVLIRIQFNFPHNQWPTEKMRDLHLAVQWALFTLEWNKGKKLYFNINQEQATPSQKYFFSHNKSCSNK